jgi:hypothetical protein
MRPHLIRAWAALALLALAVPVLATASPDDATESRREHSLHKLQEKVDECVGHKRVDVGRDFIGAHPGDPSAWSWTNNGLRGISLTLIASKSKVGGIGWYEDTGGTPVLDGVRSGVCIDGLRRRGIPMLMRLPTSVRRFGLYATQTPEGKKHRNDPPSVLFTNNLYNSPNTDSRHEPVGNDKQVLVYDVSRWLGPSTWLVACPSPDRDDEPSHEDDDDTSYLLFSVSGPSVTPVQTMSFGQVKALFR